MVKQIINIGTTDNDGTGSTIRVGGDIVNDNFTEVYSTLGDGSTITFDLSGATNGQALIYNSSTSKFEPGTASVSSAFTIAGDGGVDQTISTSDTLTIQGGTGITTTGVATDVLSVAIDGTVATASSTNTFLNKTIDANGTGNSITNLEVADLASGVLDTDLSGVSASDDTLASAKAIKSYVDTSTVLTVRDDSSTTDNVTIGTDTLSFAGGTGLTSTVTDNTVTFNIDSTVATLTGSQILTNKSIDSDNNTITNIVNADIKSSAAIANSKLANSSFTLNGVSIALGDTTTISAGTDWQSEIVADGSTVTTAVASEGYFINTTSATHTINLPGSPSLGDEVTFVDAAGTFDTNNLTVARNGEPIQGSAADLTVSVERAGFTLVYLNVTQGWLLKDK